MCVSGLWSDYFYNHKITQHFFFFTKRKPVLKEKQISSFGKAFLSKKRFLVKSRGLPLSRTFFHSFVQAHVSFFLQ